MAIALALQALDQEVRLCVPPDFRIPQMYDQHYWAQRIHNLGIGIAHASGTPTSDSLAIALQLALKPDMAARAQSIATTVQRNGAQAAAQRLIATFY